MVVSHELKKWNMQPKLELTEKEKPILKQLRVAFRAVADKCDADRIAKMTVLAFRLEFPNRLKREQTRERLRSGDSAISR